MAIRAIGNNNYLPSSSSESNSLASSQQRISGSVAPIFPSIQSRELPSGKDEAAEMAQ